MVDRSGRCALVRNGSIGGLAMEDGDAYGCASLVVTTGTFLNGLIHVGRNQRPAGRADEPPSHELARSLKSFGFPWGRLKTRTPPRLDRDSIAFDQAVADGSFAVEAGDSPPVPFSFLTGHVKREQIVCHLVHTNKIHGPVRANLAGRRCSTVRSKALVRAIAPQSKTRSFAFQKRSGTRSFSSLKASIRRRSTSTASRPACPWKFRPSWFTRFQGSRMPSCSVPDMRSNTTSFSRLHLRVVFKPSVSGGFFLRDKSTGRQDTRKLLRRD